jgi:hypothetical protein
MAQPVFIWRSGSRFLGYCPHQFGTSADSREYLVADVAKHCRENRIGSWFIVDSAPPNVTSLPPRLKPSASELLHLGEIE